MSFETNIRLIVGLGNPGKRYANTRHNLGYRVVESLAAEHGADFNPHPRIPALIAEWRADGLKWLAVKPITFMNLSGQAVIAALNFWKIPPQAMIAVVDDAELPPGDLRLRGSGSAGGHNGLKSIIDLLGSNRFARLRVGIGRPVTPQMPLSDWVLKSFEKSELLWLESSIKTATHALKSWAGKGLEAAMNQFNQKAAATPQPGATNQD
ncbi:MAG: aminoacyl-tRNA hydrolase [Verrucomicrobiae bacterium]|nr:aminoacyl-tRNA hydrolase [Verrucomicrobiae bacterium]